MTARPGIWVAVLLLGASLARGQEGFRSDKTVTLTGGISATAWRDLDGDGRSELIVLKKNGALEVRDVAAAGSASQGLLASLDLGHTDGVLVDVAPLAGLAWVVALTPKGAFGWPWRKGEGFPAKPQRLARRARYAIRSGGPRFAHFSRDVNKDGLVDLLVPTADALQLWVQKAGKRRPAFKKTARIAVAAEITVGKGQRQGDDDLFQTIHIPDLQTRDINGDGRPDLVIQHADKVRFHMQRAEGSLPFQPDVVLDLSTFKDTTPKAPLRPGWTVPGTETTRVMMRDLDADGILDYVITHRRKVWVFHGTKAGPSFTHPTSILKTADEITAVALVALDDDAYPDLFLLRVQVPSIARLITSFLGSLSVDIRAVGYRSLEGRRFDRKPGWRRSLEFKLPSLGKVIRDPESLIARIEGAGRSQRRHLRADLDGDGKDELVLFSEDMTSLEVWDGAKDPNHEDGQFDRIVREIFFERDETTWDLDRLIGFIEGLGRGQAKRLTAGAHLRFRLDDLLAGDRELVAFDAVSLDRPTLILTFRRPSAPDTLLLRLLHL
ncbi:MAG TPA: VCBS repeat-containing protein [Planctomycetes bacterium]|nr:VCBS repeat-containing protein [Planctomycetota bacterium]